MNAETSLAVIYAVIYIFVFFFGGIIGSFLGVVIERVPKGEGFVTGRSHCSSCGRQLTAAELVPVFSYIFLGGKCRTCHSKIPPRCLVIELITGGFAVLSYIMFGFSLAALLRFALICGLVAVAYIDMDTMEIPNGIIIYLAAVAVAAVFLTPETPILSHVIGLFCISVPLLLMALIIPGSFGGGDIKLMAACGLALGWQNAVFAFFTALLFGGAYAIWLMASKKLGKKDHFAFGPFLSLGTAVSLYFGSAVISWYLGLFI